MTTHPSNHQRFGDPLAAKICWSPLNKGGSGGRTRKLVFRGTHKIEFSPTALGLFFPVLFFVAGIFLIHAAIRSSSPFTIGGLIFGIVTLGVGGVFLYFVMTKSVFDKASGVFYKTHRKINSKGNLEFTPQREPLDQIHALQLVGESVRLENRSAFMSYELNLVLGSGKRINIADHGNLDAIRQDARILSEFLEKPLWDGIV